MNGICSSRRGTSLVEILVCMVVLLVGIMAVIQLFPSGFRVVRAAESETIATKLAEAELERWKNSPENLPTGILPIDDIGTVLNDQYPGPPFDAFLSLGGNAYSRGNALNIRQIIGETTRIPVGSYFETGGNRQYGSRYTLSFSPIEVSASNTPDLFDGLAIKSGDLRRRKGDKEQYPPYMRQGDYAVSYETENIGNAPAFFVAFPRVRPGAPIPTYYVSFSYWAEQGGQLYLLSETNAAVILPTSGDPPAYEGDWVPVPINVPSGYTFVEMEDDTDTCARAFTQIASGASWPPDDPYQFALADSVLGVVSFNPVGNGMYEYTASGLRPLIARIDYRIYDSRIIREDRVVPPPAPGAAEIPIKLSLKFMLDIGDPTDNPNEPTYQGLAPGMGVEVPMLIIDLATGLRVKLDPATASIDYSAGIVTLPDHVDLIDWQGSTLPGTEGVKLAGRHLRFFYRADGDWTVQCHKAYSTYAREWGTATVDYRHYRAAAGSNRLEFAPCEAEKTVSVDYSYDTNGIERKVVGESHKVSSADYHINLKAPAGSVKRIYAVVGTSFQVRVIWRDGTHWRHVDVGTNLTRSSSRL